MRSASSRSVASAPSAASAFSPASIPNFVAWYDASDAASIVQTASKVSAWHDASGNGNDLAPTRTANAPSLSGSGNSSAVVFNGGTFLVGKNAAFSQNLFNEASVFLVTNQSAAAQTSTLVWSGPYFSNPRFNVRLAESGVSHFDVNNESDGRLTATDSATGPALWSALGSYSGHAQSFSKNGTVVAHDGGPATSANGNWPLAIGATYDAVGGRSSDLFNGQIHEIVIFHRALAATETAEIEGYLACKWAMQSLLPATHPYHSACPGAAPTPTPTPTPVPTATPTAQPTPTVTPTASPSPTTAANTPKHVLTAEYFQGNGGYYGSASTMAQYADWATGGGGVSAALAAGMKTYEYADPWIAYEADNGAAWNDIKPGGANNAAEAKNCAGAGIGTNSGNSQVIFTDPTKTAAAIAHYQNSIKYWSSEEGTNTTAMFMDDAANQEYAANKPACGYSAQSLAAGCGNDGRRRRSDPDHRQWPHQCGVSER